MLQFVLAVLLGFLLACTHAASSSPSSLLSSARQIQDWIVSVRRELHEIPELGSSEIKTSARISAALTDLGIPHK
jgi:hypothetical protein